MTSPAVFVCLALVYSAFGVPSEQVADHKWLKRMRTMEQNKLQTDLMESRTNVYNPRVETKLKYETSSYLEHRSEVRKFDDIYTEDDKDEVFGRNLNIHKYIDNSNKNRNKNFLNFLPKQRAKRAIEPDKRCTEFYYNPLKSYIQHPHEEGSKNNYYYSDLDCVTVISGSEGTVIELTFVDRFHVEYHPQCSYDYLEIRDGSRGYAKLLAKVCGEAFPRQITTSGPYAWLKFHSDDTIEYEGFQINYKFIQTSRSYKVPEACYKEFLDVSHGLIDSDSIPDGCKTGTIDMLWKIQVPPVNKIYLNFTQYTLAKPNECEENFVQVFGNKLEYDARLAFYCGSVANPVTTKDSDANDPDSQINIMYVRLYATVSPTIKANFTAYRTVDPSKDDKCKEGEFDCEDNTCIDEVLRCDHYANCRLKADEEKEICDLVTESMFSQTHIKVILIIFCLILSGMSFVFFFKCIRKLYQDHKIIKEHIRQSCEDRLDTMVASRLTLDAKRLQRDSEPRASLDRDNQTNEMFKQQRKLSQQKIRPTSIDSDFIQETHLDLDDEPWRRDVNSVPDSEDVRIERNGRTRRSDLSKKEELMRAKTESVEKKQIRDVSVGAPDTKESGCQTRESLFQTDPAISSDGSGTTNSRGFSTFGYSGATIVRPSPPQTNTSQITIELLRQATEQEDKPQKKFPDRRPMSTETTRSAPDVIIVSKPIR
ncbi:unnamed protein product, partial [Brenthis ino]